MLRALTLHLYSLSMFRHLLVATARLVNLTQARRLGRNEQFAFASQIEFIHFSVQLTDMRPLAGMTLANKMPCLIVAHAVEIGQEE
jgi:hypothetical protein